MHSQPSIPTTVHPDCVEFVRAIEELLLLRQQEDGQHRQALPYDAREDDWGPRKWHRMELEDLVYCSYKRMEVEEASRIMMK